MTHRFLQAACRAPLRALAPLLLFSILPPASARVVRVVVESRAPEPASPTGKIAYQRIEGVIYGEVDPTDRRNAIIQDIGLAPRNARGMVEYAATFTLLKPLDASQSSGILLYEVVNRGASILPRDFSSGDIFLISGWQGDIPFHGKSAYGGPAETMQLPVARYPDGAPVTGPILLRFSNLKPGTPSISAHLAAGYASSGAPPIPVDTDTAHSTLTSRTFESVTGAAGGVSTVASTDWAWADCTETPFPGRPDPTSVCLRDGFDPAKLYQLVYQGKDPIVLGLGLAAVRDVAAFFRGSAKDSTGMDNPIAGRVKHAIVEGASQSGNLIRTFLNLGFNEDEDGHRVFEGAMPTIAARQTPVNLRFAIPGGASNLYEPGSDGTVWWSHWSDAARHHKPSGLLDRCTATHTCPLIIEALSSSEFWTLRASPDFVGTDNARDIPLPANVRRYYFASTQHGGGRGGFSTATAPSTPARPSPFTPPGCMLAPNPNPMWEIEHALLADLKEWVVRGTPPPPSIYPTLARGELVPATSDAMHFPVVPGLPAPDNIANPLLVYDYGSAFNAVDLSGAIQNQPPAVTGIVFPRVPRVDPDGNEVGGVRTVELQAPLGTYLGWNVITQGFFKGQYCSLSGSFLPFAQSKTEREATHDPRLSLQERYGTHDGFVCAVKRAASGLVAQRLLERPIADLIVSQAESSDVLKTTAKPSPANAAIAAQQCSAHEKGTGKKK